MTKRHVHVDTGAVFLRNALAFFVVRELVVWRWVLRLRLRPGRRLILFLFHKRATPRSLFYALLFAGAVTVVLDLLVGLVLRPLVRHWHAPWTDGSAALFHLSASERVIDSFPARRKSGLSWPAGTLVCTNHRLWFIPRAHDAEIWSRPLDTLREVRLVPPPRIAWGLIADWPQRLALQDGDGVPEVFAVPDPEAVLPWFPATQDQAQVQDQGAGTPQPNATPLSTPRRL
jgi:hypothetical protein